MRQLFLCAFLLGCGGAVDDGAPSPAPGTNAPNSVTSSDGCVRACARMTNTCGASRDHGCVDSCWSNFVTSDQARIYAECIDALSCEDIQRGMTMDFGPIGACWAKARGR